MTYQDKLKEFANFVKGGIIASCQASLGEPLNSPIHINALSQSCLLGGARAIRLEGVDNINFVRKNTKAYIVGLTKDDISEENKYRQVYITRTKNDAKALSVAGADIIAIDATNRYRSFDCDLASLINYIHHDLNLPVWADTSTVDEGINAHKLGCDIISTTLYGYTEETKELAKGPGFKLLSGLSKNIPNTILILEGKVDCPKDVSKGFKCGAHAIVVGSAITRPILITRKFVEAAVAK